MREAPHILIVEDDPGIQRLLEMSLRKIGYTCDLADTATGGYTLARANNPDLILLDLGLPDYDGVELLARIRQRQDTPVLVVSARGQEKDKIEALDAGADDYVTKPFTLGEVQARIRANLRRTRPQIARSDVFEKDGLALDFQRHRVSVDGREIHFTPIEYRLLVLLVQNPGKVLTHTYINREVWGYSDDESNQRLRVFMAGIRRKIERDTANPRYILTEVGVGYRFVDSAEEEETEKRSPETPAAGKRVEKVENC
ncbi:response regulator transcription factor [Anaerofilum sp. BX8]|uniref:Stage 0 sporulation protein A homolog n=1 Tax=Anaerofilum hominis TaxID=2763016 RepID=A0A923I789_9FIRM|nr:response regulator transcription factor [Anaerofilum hominis]MBC5581575.1 response regulator transcription factor [Anaerofilum hominis]